MLLKTLYIELYKMRHLYLEGKNKNNIKWRSFNKDYLQTGIFIVTCVVTISISQGINLKLFRDTYITYVHNRY